MPHGTEFPNDVSMLSPTVPPTIIYTNNKSGSTLGSRRLLRKHESLLLCFQVFGNCALITLVLMACAFVKLQDIPSLYRLLLIISVLLAAVIYPLSGVYKQVTKFYTMVFRITFAWLATMSALIVLAFITKTSELYSREVIITWFLSVVVLQVLLLRLNYYAVTYYRGRYTKPINSVVVGLGRTARFFSNNLDKNHWLPDRIIGMINGYPDDIPDSISAQLTFPILGDVQNIKQIVTQNKIQRLYIALPLKHAEKVEALNELLLDCQVDVIWILDVSDWKLMNHSIREVAGLPLLSLNESPVNVSRVKIRIKHVLDKLIALIMLIILSPVLLIAALAIKITSPGPIIFNQKRHGFSGEEIYIAKFRSMRVHNDTNVKQAEINDPRITTVGAFLRKSSIDELPQLFNVLQGTMSLVGPRPHAIAHNDFYCEKISKYMARHRIKPGITGLAQISGCRGETETVQKMEDRVKYDIEYISTWSLWNDFKIFVKTPLCIMGRDIY
jgi:putative colanic acid biosynthesis UDP-glucose lipid carrier transferase